MVMDFLRQGWEELAVEADAQLCGARTDSGQKTVKKTAAAAKAGAVWGEGEAGDAEQVDLGRRNHGAGRRVGLEEGPGAGMEEGLRVAKVEFQRVAGNAWVAEDFARIGVQGAEVGFGGQGGVDGDVAGGVPFRERNDAVADLHGGRGAGIGGEGGEDFPGVDPER